MTDKFRVKYDRGIRHWRIRRLEGGEVLADRLILDIDTKMEADGSLLCEGVLQASGAYSVSDTGAVVPTAHFQRTTPLPKGRVNEECMVEWCCVFNEQTECWGMYPQGDDSTFITAKEIELGAHAISSDGVLHCLAEALVDGKTYRPGIEPPIVKEAHAARLRTLIVFDQFVEVPLMKMRGENQTPG